MMKMNKIARIKNDSFTTISNVFLRDNRLSLKAKGVMALVLSLPDDWDFTIQGISAITKEGKDAIYSAIDELKECGYCYVETRRDENGKIIGNDYTFMESLTTGSFEQYTDNRNTDNRYTDYRTQLNKDNNKIKNEEIKEYKEKFGEFVKEYKKLTGKATRSVETEFNDFIKRHKDWDKVLPYLTLAIQRESKERMKAKAEGRFFPEPKLLQTYLGKQRAWELYVNIGDDVEDSANDNKYIPELSPLLCWNDYYGCYIYLGYWDGHISDGYKDDERPNGAYVMLNNGRGFVIWDKESRTWNITNLFEIKNKHNNK